MKGLLYINWTETATPLKDSEVLNKIKQEWSLVVDGTQTKQFNICNELVYAGIQILCMRGDIIAERIHFMLEGKEVDRNVKVYGSSKLPIASPKSIEIPEFFTVWMREFMGF